MTDTIVVELIPECYKKFEELCVQTAFDYIDATEGLSPNGLTTSERAIMELHSVLVCQLIRNIIASFASEMTTRFHNCTDSYEAVLEDFIKAISGFLNSFEFRKQLRTLVGEMFSASTRANQDMH